MSSYLKRRVALILAVAIISAQLSACKKLNEVPVQNEAPVATVQQENTEEPAEATEPEVGGLEWLQENLENLKQSLLDGDYAKVVDQLLEMRDELKDNARYNALLYIAYSGKGDKDKANDLLNNKNLNRNEFMDAFLEFTNALKGNAGAKSAEQQLMDAMMHLAQKDKTAYNAAVRVGQNIRNENPSDPNAYVVMYIAALAGNDKAAMKDVLSQAKANGISAEVLSTATVEYIERVNVTDVTTEDAKKGIENSTSYNGKGEVLKTEETVTNKDGTKTKVIRSSDGGISDEITYSKGGHILSAVHYDCDYAVEKDADGNEKIVAKVTGKIETTYKNGKLESVTYYTGKGEKTMSVSLNPKTGEVKEAKVFSSDGNASDMPEDQRKLLDFEMEDGRVKSYVVPRTFENGTKGYMRIGLEYFNGYGAPVNTQNWELGENENVKLTEVETTIDYDADKMGLRTADEVWINQKNGEFGTHAKVSYTFDDLTRTGSNTISYMEDGKVLRSYERDADDRLITVEWNTYDGDELKEKHRSESTFGEDGQETARNTFLVSTDGKKTLTFHQQFTYNPDGSKYLDSSVLYETDGKTVAEKKEVYYAENGAKTEIYDTFSNGVISLKKVTKYGQDGQTKVGCVEKSYYTNGQCETAVVEEYRADGTKTQTQEVFNEQGIKTTQKYTEYQKDGKTRSKENILKYNEKGILTSSKEGTFNEKGEMISLATREYFSNGSISSETLQLAPNGTVEKIIQTSFDEYGNKSLVTTTNTSTGGKQIDFYSLTGELVQTILRSGTTQTTIDYTNETKTVTDPYGETVYNVSDGKETLCSKTEYNTIDDDYDFVDRTTYYGPDGKTVVKVKDAYVLYLNYYTVPITKTVIEYDTDGKEVSRTSFDLQQGNDGTIYVLDGDTLQETYETNGVNYIRTSYTYSPNGSYEYTQQLYDANNLPKQEVRILVDESGNQQVVESVKYTYGTSGDYEVKRDTLGENGQITVISYYDSGNRLVSTQETDELGATVVKEFFYAEDGNSQGYTETQFDKDQNPLTAETKKVNSAGQPEQVIRTDYKTGTIVETNYSYDEETGELTGYTQVASDADGKITSFKSFDAKGNEISDANVKETQETAENEVKLATEEVKPTEPEQPTEEVKPTEPEQPTEEVKPTEPEQPTEEVKPTEPEQPTEEVKPTEPEKPTEEVKPTEPEKPTEEVKPTEPEQPTEEVKPTAPETPAETETKTEDKAPAESAPSTPASAGDSGSASTPAAPAASVPASSAPAAPAASAPASAPAASSSASSAPAASAPSSAPAAEG